MTSRLSERRAARRVGLLFAAGLALSIFMVANSQVAGDQLNLLARGWLFAAEGVWLPYGSPLSGGGQTPGGVTSLVLGLPLLVWSHHRAAAALVLLTHIAAYLLLDRLVRRMLGPEERLLFAFLYWLSPWRLFYSAFLWNPNYLFLCGALHLWTAASMRRRARFGPTLAHGLVLGLALQLAVFALPLAIASALLWWRGYLRVHRGGAITAILLVALSLAPWVAAVVADPALLPQQTGFIGRGLVFFYPIYQGVTYLLRYASLALDQSLSCLDFSGGPGAEGMAGLRPAIDLTTKVFYALSIPVPLWAHWRLWRGGRRAWFPRVDATISDRGWLEGVVRLHFAAAVIVFALSPTSVMRWHGLGLFHVAVLPLVLAAGALARRGLSRRARIAFGSYAAASLLLVAGIATASPPYRCGGDRCGLKSYTLPRLSSDHPMLDDLGIRATCPPVVDDPEGWWMDVLPE